MPTIDIYKEEYISKYGIPQTKISRLNFDRNIKETNALGKIVQISEDISLKLKDLEDKELELQEILRNLLEVKN